MSLNVPDRKGRQGPSPLEGERIRRLSRGQIEDRREELGDLYAETSGGAPQTWDRDRDRELFLRRLAVEVQRPGFALLVAETGVLQELGAAGGTTGSEAAGTDSGRGGAVALTGCAYGFPVRADGPWWRSLAGCLPRDLLGLATSGRLFVISGLLVHSRVRTKNQSRDWNLARRLQRRLLADHATGLTDHATGLMDHSTGLTNHATGLADQPVGLTGHPTELVGHSTELADHPTELADHPAVLGVTLVDRGDTVTLRVLRSWGWRPVTAAPHETPVSPPCRALVIDP